jgi:hypothetical protein
VTPTAERTEDNLRPRSKISAARAAAAQKRTALQLLLDEGLHETAVVVVQALLTDVSALADLTNEVSQQSPRPGEPLAPLDVTARVAAISEQLPPGTRRVPADVIRRLDEAFALVGERITRLERTVLRTPSEKRQDELLRRGLKILPIAAAAVLLVVGVAVLRQDRALAARQAAFMDLPASRRVRDLRRIRDALEAYHSKYGSYPKSEGFDGVRTCWGRSTSDWIQGLVPEFLPALPRDPRESGRCNEQYMYKSNGWSFKLIAHEPEDTEAVKAVFPDMIDPVRHGAAYGFWTFPATFL